MTDLRKLRADVKRLIKIGEANYQKRCDQDPYGTLTAVNLRSGEVTQRRFKRPPADREQYAIIYHDARDLLLKHGYEKQLDPKVQKLYFELIPDSEQFLRERESTLKKLSSKDKKIRLEAAKYVDNKARAAFRMEQWLRHPTTVETLINALQKEEDPGVCENLVRGLGGIYWSYFSDLRILPELERAWDSQHKRVVDAAIRWGAGINRPEFWTRVCDMLGNKLSQQRLQLLLHAIKRDTPVKWKRRLQPLLISQWNAKLNRESKASLAATILNTADERTVDGLRELLDGMKGLKTALKDRSKYLTTERNKFLNAKLKL
ncbi:MAG: HEAT repeat domain-containing protein [Planctomycetales bacterium]|nr:HEAT repeat domain-containing protein [Planctomycetales bacterium]